MLNQTTYCTITLKVTLAISYFCYNDHRSISHDSLQCVAGERRRRSSGPVVLRIDNAVIMSEDDFEYVDNPQVFSLRNNEVIKRFRVFVMMVCLYSVFAVEVLI